MQPSLEKNSRRRRAVDGWSSFQQGCCLLQPFSAEVVTMGPRAQLRTLHSMQYLCMLFSLQSSVAEWKWFGFVLLFGGV